MNYKVSLLFLVAFFSIPTASMEPGDNVALQEILEKAVHSQDAQLVHHTICQGADPLKMAPCGEHICLVALLDTIWNKMRRNVTWELVRAGLFYGAGRQLIFDAQMPLTAKGVLYILMKAGARNAVCNPTNCPNGGDKRECRVWFFAQMELLEKKIDKLRDDCYYGRIETIDEAVTQKVNLFTPDPSGNTMLHTAFAQNNSGILKKLLEHDQTLLTCKNNEGKFPTDMARKR